MLKAGENSHLFSTPPSHCAVAGVIKARDFISKVLFVVSIGTQVCPDLQEENTKQG